MKLRRLTRKTCPRTGGQWFACIRQPWAKSQLSAEDYNPTKPAKKAKRTQERRHLAASSALPPPTPRLAMDDPERAALYAEVRAVGRCVSCGSRHRLTVDHIVPRHLGGGNHRANLQCLCQRCNKQKGLSIWAPAVTLKSAA